MNSMLSRIAESIASMISVEFLVVLIFGIFSLWAVASFVRSHRRIADSLEELADKMTLIIEPKAPPPREAPRSRENKEWEIGRPSNLPPPRGPQRKSTTLTEE